MASLGTCLEPEHLTRSCVLLTALAANLAFVFEVALVADEHKVRLKLRDVCDALDPLVDSSKAVLI